MADNVTLNAGSGGSVLATDDISSVHYQRVKVTWGVDGTATDVSDSNPLPIDDAGGSLTVDNAALSVTGGGVESGAIRVTLANDSTGLLSVDDNGGSLTVDGTVTANLSATDNAVLDQIEVNTSYGDNTGAGTEAGALRVTLPTDCTGVLSVDDNSGSLTVDNGGTFVTQEDGALLTAAQLIDDPIFADDAAFTLASSKVSMSGAIRDDSLTTLTAIEGDAVPLRVGSTGALHVTGGGGGTEYTDDTSVHASGSTVGNAMMAAAVPTDTSVDANDIGQVAMSLDRRLHTDAQIVGQDANLTVDLGATDNAVLDQIETNTSYGDSTGGGTEAAALRVTVASDSTGLLSVDDGGGSLTIDGTVTANAGTGTFTVDGSGVTQPVSGTVTANLGATDNAVLDQIEVNTSYGDSVGGGTEAAALRVTLANDSTGLVSVDDNGGSLTVDNADITTVAGAVSGSEMQVDVVAALPAGTNNIGDVDVATIAAGSNLVGDVGLSGARTSGGTTLYKNIDVDESEDQVKGTAGQVYWIHAMNLSATAKFLKFYNATAASVTVGTTVPDLTFPLATQGDTNGAGFTLSIPNGIAFGTAITIAATTGVADNDSGAPGANEVVVNLGYA